MRQPRTDPEIRRQQILEAATRLIGLQGYNGLTVQELARKCGLTNGGLLYYFGSKEQLLVAILEERDRQESAIVHADLERAAGGDITLSRRNVLHAFRAIMRRSATNPELLRFYIVLQSEALNRDHPAHEYFLRREAMVLREFTRMLTDHAENPKSAARQMLAVIEGLEHQWLRADQEFDLLAELDKAIPLILPWARAIQDTDKTSLTT